MAAECQQEIARLREEVGRLSVALAVEKRWRETRGQLPADREEAIAQLITKVKDLEAAKGDILDDYVDAENGRLDLEEAMDHARRAIGDAIELTLREGPTVGMQRIRQYWIDHEHDRYGGLIPYDWLSRWAS